MNRKYVGQKIEKIFQDKELDPAKKLAMSCVWVAANLKGQDLSILDVSKTSSLADYFILVSAQNTVQSKAISEEIRKQLKSYVEGNISLEGQKEGEWILLDAGDVIVHVFTEAKRNVYDLESLWKECPQMPIPEEYYMQASVSDAQAQELAESEEYF